MSLYGMVTLTPILLDAKKEYVHQLADVLSPYVMRTISALYDQARHKSKVFRQLLQQVPSWNDQVLKDRASEIERRHSQLQNLITACCVSYTKVLGSIRLNTQQQSNVRLSVPETSTFIHGVYIYVAKEFFYEPRLLYADRATKHRLIEEGIEDSVRKNVPIDQLLDAYLSPAVDAKGIDPLAASQFTEFSDFTDMGHQDHTTQPPQQLTQQHVYEPQPSFELPATQQHMYEPQPTQPAPVDPDPYLPEDPFPEPQQPQPQEPQQNQPNDDPDDYGDILSVRVQEPAQQELIMQDTLPQDNIQDDPMFLDDDDDHHDKDFM